MLQDCYMDALGGMIVYAPMDLATMNIAVSGDADPSEIPILPSGFSISSDGRRSTTEDGGTLLTLAFQILVSGKTTRSREVNERSVDTVSALISSTVQRIKGLLNCPQCWVREYAVEDSLLFLLLFCLWDILFRGFLWLWLVMMIFKTWFLIFLVGNIIDRFIKIIKQPLFHMCFYFFVAYVWL